MSIKGREKYNQDKLDKLLDYLKVYEALGEPQDYEIQVDGFKAVRRTSNTNMFNLYENFVNADTRSIEVLFYQGTSNNNDKHIFYMQDDPKEAELNGVDIDTRIKDHVNKARKEWDSELLQKEHEEWKEYAAELEANVERLEKEVETIKNTQSPLHGFLGEFGSSLVSGIVRQNPKIIKSIPALSGLLETDADPKGSGKEPGSDIQFDAGSELPDQESIDALSFVRNIKTHFQGEKFDKLMAVIDLIAQDTNQLDSIIEQLKNRDHGNP